MPDFDELPDANSTVVSFRLNETDQREKRAMEYIARQMAEGKKKRAIIVDALLAADQSDHLIKQMAEMQRQSLDILQKLENGAITVNSGDTSAEPSGQGLPEDFKAGLRKLARPVVRLDE